MPLLSIRLFGEFAATDFRGNALSIGNRRTQALLICLALSSGKVSIGEIGELLFGGSGADSSVFGLIRDLRYALRYLSDEIVIDDGRTVQFKPEAVFVDVRQFAEYLSSPSISNARKAVELYRGNLLETFTTGIQAFDEWLGEQRLTLWRGALSTFGMLLTVQMKAGWWEEAVEIAGRLLSLDPSQEVVHRTLMRLQLEQGRADAALRRYQECADILRRDYGRGPAPETERLHEDILAALAESPAPRDVAPVRMSGGPTLVLVVEDDLVSSALIDGFLAGAGYEVVTVADGADALLELGRRKFDLLVLDINIPTLSGLKVFEIMLQKHIHTPALFITGMPGTEVETQSLEMGAAGFLRKPIRKEVLLPKVRGILRRSGKNAAAQS
jgi:CheY-like chemotaxis protein